MRISRIDSFGGSCPPLKPSMKMEPPPGPAAGPASAFRSAARSSGLSDNASRSSPRMTSALALFEGSAEKAMTRGWLALKVFYRFEHESKMNSWRLWPITAVELRRLHAVGTALVYRELLFRGAAPAFDIRCAVMAEEIVHVLAQRGKLL